MRIRRATVDDAEGGAEVLVTAWQWAYPGVLSDELIAARQVEPTAARIRASWNPQRLSLVVVDDDGLIVAAATENDPPNLPGYDAEIGSLYVRVGHCRQGHGQALLRAMAAGFLERGARSLCIHTLRENRIGRRFYERFGGTLAAEDTWQSHPAVWYVWPDMAVIVSG